MKIKKTMNNNCFLDAQKLKKQNRISDIKQLSLEDFTNQLVNSASSYLENGLSDFHLTYYHKTYHNLPNPKRIHPSIADKLILRSLAIEIARDIPKAYRFEFNTKKS